MATGDTEPTLQKTEWTGALIDDLCSALRSNRDDETVRAFAKELMTDKGLPGEYLVRKVETAVGPEQAERLDVLLRGRIAVDKSKAESAQSRDGVRGFLSRLFS